MTVRAFTAWGCPCTAKLDAEGQFASATDHFGTPLCREQVQVPQTLTALWENPQSAPQPELVAA